MFSSAQKSLCFLLMLGAILIAPLSVLATDNPVIVRQAASDTPLANDHQIIRTSSGRLYYFSGNAGHTATWDGWVEVSSSVDGVNWALAGTRDQWHSSITIDDIIAAEGARIPDAANSPKQFKVGFILLTREGDNATQATAATETLRTAWAGRFAELTQGKGSIADIPASLTINIDTPTDNSTITGPDVTVTGTIINSTGAETGITVNGQPATISGSRFTANHVPLQDGTNSINITATDANGLTTTTTRTITAQAGHYLRISSNVDSGTGPLTVSLRLDGSFTIANPSVSIAGPVAVTPVFGESQSEFTVTLNVEGQYTITASAVRDDGNTYTDSVVVTVISKNQLDALLRAKWEGMRTALAAGDVNTAVTNFNPLSREIYRKQFTNLTASLPTIAAGMGNIMLVKAEDDQAEFDMRDTIDGIEYSFYLLFVKGGDGIWTIRNF